MTTRGLRECSSLAHRGRGECARPEWCARQETLWAPPERPASFEFFKNSAPGRVCFQKSYLLIGQVPMIFLIIFNSIPAGGQKGGNIAGRRCPFRGGTAFKASRAGPRNRLSWRYAPRNRREEAATADLTPPAIEQQRCCPRFFNTLSPGKPFTSANCVDPESGFPSIGARAGDRGRSPGCMDGNRGPSRGRI